MTEELDRRSFARLLTLGAAGALVAPRTSTTPMRRSTARLAAVAKYVRAGL